LDPLCFRGIRKGAQAIPGGKEGFVLYSTSRLTRNISIEWCPRTGGHQPGDNAKSQDSSSANTNLIVDINGGGRRSGIGAIIFSWVWVDRPRLPRAKLRSLKNMGRRLSAGAGGKLYIQFPEKHSRSFADDRKIFFLPFLRFRPKTLRGRALD